MIQAINPKNGKLIKTYESLSDQDALGKLEISHKHFFEWKHKPFKEKAQLFYQLADILNKNIKTWSELITNEMGKPIEQSRAEIEKCQWVCRYYAEHAEDFLKKESITTDYQVSDVVFQPLGVILAVMPWNFPFWQVFRFAAPTLMAGNTAILKHASNVPGCSMAIQQAFINAGFPEGVFQSLLIGHKQIATLIKDPRVRAVTLTGSTQAGKKVAVLAAESLKKSVLELGGNDAYLILGDADVERAAEKCSQSRLLNAGQSCIAAKRFLVHKNIYNSFCKKIKNIFESKKWGDPILKNSDLGPMARLDLRDGLHQQVQKSIEQGAKLLTGGMIPKELGAYYPPTVLADIHPGMVAFEEELFGPVASITPVESLAKAIELSNKSCFGLGGGIFSRNTEKAYQIAKDQLDTGSVFINDFAQSDPRLPFGGVKGSGYGRELSSFGIKEFVNTKTLCVQR